MKNFLRILLGVLGFIVVAILVLSFVEPKDVSVSRTIYINSPNDMVWEQVTNFKNWTHWSPWYEMDTNAVMTYSGTDGQVGSAFNWKGDKKKVGEGNMKITAIKPGQMSWDLHFLKPQEGNATGMFTLKDSSDGVKVSWIMNMHFGFPTNAMLVFMNLDKMLGGDFEKGLSNIKKYCESKSATFPKVAIQQVSFPAHTYVGMRKTVPMAEMQKFFTEAYAIIGKEAGKRIIGPAAAIYFTWDTVHHISDLAAVFPVADTIKPIKGASFFTISNCNAIMAVHNGAYSNLGLTHGALMHQMGNKKMQMNLVVEEYLSGPHETPDSSKWMTNIYYLIK